MLKKEKCLNSKLVHQSRVFKVYEDDVVLPDGRKSRRGWIAHGASVAIVPINSQDEIILIKQYRYPTQKFLLEIPAGNIDKGSRSPAASAQRELAEEIGFQAKKLTKIFEGYSLPGYCQEYMHYFLAQDLYPKKLTADDDEFIELKPVSFTKALTLIKNKKIIDSKTALGIYLAKEYLKIK